MKFHGRPEGKLLRPTGLEEFANGLVEDLQNLSAAERSWRAHGIGGERRGASDRVGSFREKIAYQYFEKITEMHGARTAALDRLITLLAHHNFNIFTDSSVPECAKKRLRALIRFLENSKTQAFISAKEMRVHVLDIGTSRKTEVDKFDKVISAWTNGEVAQEEETKLELRDIANAAMRSKRKECMLSSHFQNWKKSIHARRIAALKITHHSKLRDQRAKAVAFGKWNREIAFFRALQVLSRNRALSEIKNKQEAAGGFTKPREKRRGKDGWDSCIRDKTFRGRGSIIARVPPSVGRRMPWDTSPSS